MSERTPQESAVENLRSKMESCCPTTIRTIEEVLRLQRELAGIVSFSDDSSPLKLPYSSMSALSSQHWK